jgi:hypothetical protein
MPEICKEVADREMPPEEYLLMHPRTNPSHAEIEAICSWVHSSSLPGSERAEKE